MEAVCVTLANFVGHGRVGVYDAADHFACEDMYPAHTFDGTTSLEFGRRGGCTAAFAACGGGGERFGI